MSDRCSFCSTAVGESQVERIVRRLDSEPSLTKARPDILDRIAEGSPEHHHRRVKILLPGPAELFICDLCVELYWESAQRELSSLS